MVVDTPFCFYGTCRSTAQYKEKFDKLNIMIAIIFKKAFYILENTCQPPKYDSQLFY